MQKMISLLLFLLIQFSLKAQLSRAGDSASLVNFNQQLDDRVVTQDIAFLKNGYSDDFVFSHGSGRVDGKSSWLNSVVKGNFSKREHDSVHVELHGTVAILRGKLSVEKKNKEETDRYWLRYIRVYILKDQKWQLISHMTTAEFHLPG